MSNLDAKLSAPKSSNNSFLGCIRPCKQMALVFIHYYLAVFLWHITGIFKIYSFSKLHIITKKRSSYSSFIQSNQLLLQKINDKEVKCFCNCTCSYKWSALAKHFFNCYLASSRPALDYYWGGTLTYPMLSTAFERLHPEGPQEPHSKGGSASMTKQLMGFELGTF